MKPLIAVLTLTSFFAGMPLILLGGFYHDGAYQWMGGIMVIGGALGFTVAVVAEQRGWW